ncbi:MAG: hypothetical protein IT383_23765 [Deltaproteobacteria bacterium]|nr:hypothetical protein [Deltaproteobacteria bacterium]
MLALACACEEPPRGPPGPECVTLDGCGAGEVCAGGRCVEGPPCYAIDDWPYCREVFEEAAPGAGRTAVCEPDAPDSFDAHCRIACEIDDECSAGSLCTDFGRCMPGLRRAAAGTPRGEHAPLLAGVGEALLDVPLTTSLGGLSERAGSGDGRWAEGMEPAVGSLDALWARAASLDVGDGRLLVVRLPIIFPTGELTEAIAQRLEDETGDDWRDALVVVATHTHSAPARFLRLLGASEPILAPFGIGTFRTEVFDRMVDAGASAARAALDGQQPARLGWTIVEAFDVDDRIARDRRVESPPFDDNRALLIRVDDDAGAPLFVMTSFGVHPTLNGSSWATNDIVGGVERALEEALHDAPSGRVVPALFLQGNGGSMSPGIDLPVPLGNDATGALFVDAVLDELLAIETRADVSLDARAHRFPITVPALGYAPGEWQNDGGPPFGGDVTYGGMNCFRNVPPDVEPYDAHLAREDMDCGISFHTFLFNHPPSPFQRAQITAIELDGLALVTIPGELSMELAWGIAAELSRSAGLDPLATFTLGYANEHLMYLLPTTLDEDAPPYPGYLGLAPRALPPFAFSPLRGGYEADMSVFGDKLGGHLVAHSAIAWSRMQERAPPSLETAPAVFSPDTKEPIDHDETALTAAGAIVVDLPPSVPRRALTPFAFIGGDVAYEGQGPEVALVREDGSPVLLASGRAFTSRHASVLPIGVAREQSGDEDGVWTWTAYLELPPRFPVGQYRLVANGKVGAGAYTVESAVFDVGPAALAVSGRREGADLVVSVAFFQQPPELDETAIRGHISTPPPLRSATVTVRPAAGGAELTAPVVNGEARVIGVDAGALVVLATDTDGNVGSADVP